VPCSWGQGHLHHLGFGCANPPRTQSAVPPLPFSPFRGEAGASLWALRAGPTPRGAVEGSGWSLLPQGLPLLPHPSCPRVGWGTASCSGALVGLTWRAHSAPSPRAGCESPPRCPAASAGPAPSPGPRSPADGLQGQRESITALGFRCFTAKG